MALSVEDYIRIAEIQNRPKSLQELIIPEAVRFGSQALGAGIGHLFGGGGRADDEEQKKLGHLFAGREWNAQNYQAGLANQYDAGIGAMKRRLQHAGLENYANEFGINVDPSLYVPPTFPQTFQTSYQDARGAGVSPLAGTELDTSRKKGGGFWGAVRKIAPIAAMGARFLPGVGPALGAILPALSTAYGLGGGTQPSQGASSYSSQNPMNIDWG